VFAVNPMSVSRYRDRHSSSGAKSDPGDAKVLADLVRTDRHNHRPAAPDSDLAEAVKVLARAHQSMIWNRRRQANQLRSALREFYPAALAAFDDLTSGDATAVLQAAPEPRLGAGLSKTQIAAALRRGIAPVVMRSVSDQCKPPASAFGEMPTVAGGPGRTQELSAKRRAGQAWARSGTGC
jgi:transposase